MNLVEVKDKSAEWLFTSLSFEMSNHGLQIQNVVDFEADTTNVMLGDDSIEQKINNSHQIVWSSNVYAIQL